MKFKTLFINGAWVAVAAASFYTVPLAFGGGLSILGTTVDMLGSGLKTLGFQESGNKFKSVGGAIAKFGLTTLLSPFVDINKGRMDAVPKVMAGMGVVALGITSISYYLPVILPVGLVLAAGGTVMAGIGASMQAMGFDGAKIRAVGGAVAVAGASMVMMPALPTAFFAESGYNLITGKEAEVGYGENKTSLSVTKIVAAVYHKIGVRDNKTEVRDNEAAPRPQNRSPEAANGYVEALRRERGMNDQRRTDGRGRL